MGPKDEDVLQTGDRSATENGQPGGASRASASHEANGGANGSMEPVHTSVDKHRHDVLETSTSPCNMWNLQGYQGCSNTTHHFLDSGARPQEEGRLGSKGANLSRDVKSQQHTDSQPLALSQTTSSLASATTQASHTKPEEQLDKQPERKKKRSRLPENEGEDSESSSEDEEHQKHQFDSARQDIAEYSPKNRFIRFNRKLGSRPNKSVFVGFDSDTGKEVTWNIIELAGMEKATKAKVEDEIHMLKSLNHPRIIKFVSAWVDKKPQRICFITERVTGSSLLSYIRRNEEPLKLKVMQNWCKQILEGLHYLHSKEEPIIHRDLKCDNIFIHGNVGDVLIGDLGHSTTLKAPRTMTNVGIGTPGFVAPEVQDQNYSTPVDIYAFGMCLVEMVCQGRSPYAECPEDQITRRVRSGEIPSEVRRINDKRLREMIEKCLRQDPALRPTAMDLLSDPWITETEADAKKFCELLPETTPSKDYEEEEPQANMGYSDTKLTSQPQVSAQTQDVRRVEPDRLPENSTSSMRVSPTPENCNRPSGITVASTDVVVPPVRSSNSGLSGMTVPSAGVGTSEVAVPQTSCILSGLSGVALVSAGMGASDAALPQTSLTVPCDSSTEGAMRSDPLASVLTAGSQVMASNTDVLAKAQEDVVPLAIPQAQGSLVKISTPASSNMSAQTAASDANTSCNMNAPTAAPVQTSTQPLCPPSASISGAPLASPQNSGVDNTAAQNIAATTSPAHTSVVPPSPPAAQSMVVPTSAASTQCHPVSTDQLLNPLPSSITPPAGNTALSAGLPKDSGNIIRTPSMNDAAALSIAQPPAVGDQTGSAVPSITQVPAVGDSTAPLTGQSGPSQTISESHTEHVSCPPGDTPELNRQAPSVVAGLMPPPSVQEAPADNAAVGAESTVPDSGSNTGSLSTTGDNAVLCLSNTPRSVRGEHVCPQQPMDDTGEDGMNNAIDIVGEDLITDVVLNVKHVRARFKISFNFDRSKDSAIMLAKELHDERIVPPETLMGDLIEHIHLAVKLRCNEIERQRMAARCRDSSARPEGIDLKREGEDRQAYTDSRKLPAESVPEQLTPECSHEAPEHEPELTPEVLEPDRQNYSPAGGACGNLKQPSPAADSCRDQDAKMKEKRQLQKEEAKKKNQQFREKWIQEQSKTSAFGREIMMEDILKNLGSSQEANSSRASSKALPTPASTPPPAGSVPWNSVTAPQLGAPSPHAPANHQSALVHPPAVPHQGMSQHSQPWTVSSPQTGGAGAPPTRAAPHTSAQCAHQSTPQQQPNQRPALHSPHAPNHVQTGTAPPAVHPGLAATTRAPICQSNPIQQTEMATKMSVTTSPGGSRMQHATNATTTTPPMPLHERPQMQLQIGPSGIANSSGVTSSSFANLNGTAAESSTRAVPFQS